VETKYLELGLVNEDSVAPTIDHGWTARTAVVVKVVAGPALGFSQPPGHFVKVRVSVV